MKLRFLKAGIVSMSVMATITGSAYAYFTSSVVAAGNQIQTGSLIVAVDTTKNHTTPPLAPIFGTDAYQVAIDNNGTTTLNSDPTKRFETWSSAMPGDNGFDIWIGVRNVGNGPFVYKLTPSGAWSGIRSTPECQTEVTNPKMDLVTFENILQYSAGSDCEASNECKTIKDSLVSFAPAYSYSPLANSIVYPSNLKMSYVGSGYGSFFGSSDGTSTGTPLVLSPSQFVVYKTTMKLDGANTSDCYQNASFDWSMQVRAYQDTVGVNWNN